MLSTTLVLPTIGVCLIVFSAALTTATTPSTGYTITGTARGPTYDGIGGLSGGGGTSVYLREYGEPARSRILDYLFAPRFAASLPMLKVEIGGGGDTTDGSELSTENAPGRIVTDPGYEIWLAQEAKKRNPNIKLYALPWSFPKWVSCSNNGFPDRCPGGNSPFVNVSATVKYIMDYVNVLGANHGLRLDYIGIWNERPWSNDYIIALHKALRANPFSVQTKIVAPDGFDTFTKFAQEMLDDAQLRDAVYALGAHYPGTESTPLARRLIPEKKALWASEDDSTFNSERGGAGCLARILNQNFVNGLMSSTIVWNLAAAYPKGTRWYRASLLNAFKPWSGGSYGTPNFNDGSFSVGPMVWVTAHTTQFTEPDTWRYLKSANFVPAGAPSGSGKLQKGGSYVTLVSGDGNFTMVIEKMTRDMSPCVRPVLPDFEAVPETARFYLSPDLVAMAKKNSRNSSSMQLFVRRTHFATPVIENDKSEQFEPSMASIQVEKNSATGAELHFVELFINVDSLYTLTTTWAGMKGSFGETAKSMDPTTIFPSDTVTNLDKVGQNAPLWSDQNGGFMTIVDPSAANNNSSHILRQVVPLRPVTWGKDTRPHSFLGHEDMVGAQLGISARLADTRSGVVLGLRGRGDDSTQGIFLAVDGVALGKFGLWTDLAFVPDIGLIGAAMTGPMPLRMRPGTWYSFSVSITPGGLFSAEIDGRHLVKDLDIRKIETGLNFVPASGFAVVGTKWYGNGTAFTDFKNARLEKVQFASCATAPVSAATPLAGWKVCNAECASEAGSRAARWRFDVVPNGRVADKTFGRIELVDAPGLCIRAMRSSSSSSSSAAVEPMWLELQPCSNATDDPNQSWSWLFDGISADSERQSFIYATVEGTKRCLDIYQQRADKICAQLDAWPCNTGKNQAFFFDQNSGEIVNPAGTCVGICKP